MKRSKLIMGMPTTVEILDNQVTTAIFDDIFKYLRQIDIKYSTYKETSEVSKINEGLLDSEWSNEMKQVLKLCEQTKQQTNGFFNVFLNGRLDPSGLVKGWAIRNACQQLLDKGFKNFYIDIGGDVEMHGSSGDDRQWKVGIRNPFKPSEIIKTLKLTGKGVATSGTYLRGQHIYNPKSPKQKINDIASLTVVGPNIYEADRFATAAFAMGKTGINFIEQLDGFEGYLVDSNQRATLTSGLERYVVSK